MRNRIHRLLTESANTAEIGKLFYACLKKYFPELLGKFSNTTKFSVFYDPNKAGLYSTKYQNGFLVSDEIKINRDIFMSPDKLKSVVWHEAIHYAEEHLKSSSGYSRYPKWLQSEIHHSGFFKEWMDRINKNEGYDLISVTDEYIQGQESASEFYVHLFKYGERIIVFWMSQNNKKTEEYISKTMSYFHITGHIVFPTKDIIFKSTAKVIPSLRGLGFSPWEDFKKKINPELADDLEQKLQQSIVKENKE